METARTTTRRRDSSTDRSSAAACPDCRHADPEIRHRHYLALARTIGLDGLRLHLSEDLAARYGQATDRIQGYLSSIMQWASDQVTSHSDQVDEQTGAPLPWWEARRRMIAAMQDSTERMRQNNIAAEQARQVVVEAWHKLEIPDPTPLREPGEEDVDDDDAVSGPAARCPLAEEAVTDF